ncbi:hypothetical protein [Pseudoduganella aquatica]|uniref:hypothetical protein n=1 Tax=Pseudoduganella aquatica TaxID=2660641 RepID=UPI001E286644|nr:hypothetical protein [Pseudoduganella aquatica]
MKSILAFSIISSIGLFAVAAEPSFSEFKNSWIWVTNVEKHPAKDVTIELGLFVQPGSKYSKIFHLLTVNWDGVGQSTVRNGIIQGCDSHQGTYTLYLPEESGTWNANGQKIIDKIASVACGNKKQ